MKSKYEYYKVYKCPEKPDEYGEYIGKTPILKQAKTACKEAKKQGKKYFIKGVTKEGIEIVLL